MASAIAEISPAILLEKLDELHDCEMPSSVLTLGNFIKTIYKTKHRSLPPSDILIRLQIRMGEAAYRVKKYRRAKSLLEAALDHKIYFGGRKGPKAFQLPDGYPSETNLKYILHQVYLEINMVDEAQEILLSIPPKQRTPKVNFALAKLYYRSENVRATMACYKDILKVLPLALDVATELTAIGAKDTEVTSFMNITSVPEVAECVHGWVKAHSTKFSNEYEEAIKVHTKILGQDSPLCGDPMLTLGLAQVYLYVGKAAMAKQLLLQVKHDDPTLYEFVPPLTLILLSERNELELAQLLPRGSSSQNDYDQHVWMPMAALYFLQNNMDTALYCAQRAILALKRNYEAFLLKGVILFEIKKISSALAHFKEAYKVAPARYEATKGIIECLMMNKDYKEAFIYAVDFSRMENYSPRSLALHALVMVNDSTEKNKNRAKMLLKRALTPKPTNGFAACLLAYIMEEEGHLEDAIKILEDLLPEQPTTKVLNALGSLYLRRDEPEQASDLFHRTLRLDPNDQWALDNLKEIGKDGDKVATTKCLGTCFKIIIGSTETEAEEIDGGSSDHEMDSAV